MNNLTPKYLIIFRLNSIIQNLRSAMYLTLNDSGEQIHAVLTEQIYLDSYG